MPAALYQLELEFQDRGPELAEPLMIVESLLRDELTLGTVEGNDISAGGRSLIVVTADPAAYLRAALPLLHSIQVLPVAAAYRRLDHDREGRAAPAGPKTTLPLV